MDEKRPYEMNEPRFSHLPDENSAWEKMKAKLDEEDRRRRFVLPPFFSSCGGWALLALLLAGGALWVYTSFGTGEKRNPKAAHVPPRGNTSSNTENVVAGKKNVKGNKDVFKTGTVTKQKGETVNFNVNNNVGNNQVVQPKPTAYKKQATGKKDRVGIVRKSIIVGATAAPANAALHSKGKRDVLKSDHVSADTATIQPALQTKETNSLPQNPVATAADTILTAKDSASSETGQADSTQAQKLKREKRRFVVAAGFSMQQQLPFGGQQWTPYNYMGRKGSLADYVPAVYVRLYANEKWFLQSGFRYGAPQYSKEFVYTQNYKLDTLGAVQSTTAYRLKKTYYHQLPLSFHYRVSPSWSLGAGFVYNKFFGAVSEREERERITPTTDTLISKALVRDRSDSLFRSHNLQLLLETEFKWKRFSAGVQYTQGVQPFIEYTNAQGQQQKQRNYAVNLFVRYRLWRTKN
ncbi:MAG: hypothetical protein ACO1NX_08880 [Chitinophagaceae bacterium]